MDKNFFTKKSKATDRSYVFSDEPTYTADTKTDEDPYYVCEQEDFDDKLPPPSQKHPKKKKTVVVTAIIIVALLCAVSLYFVKDTQSTINLPVMSANGNMTVYNDDEVSIIKDKINDTALAASINSEIEFNTALEYGEFNFDNYAFNNANIYLEIFLENQSEPVYRSKYLLPPNSHIAEDSLDVVVPKGNYDATVLLKAVDERGNIVAHGYIPIKIKVLNN